MSESPCMNERSLRKQTVRYIRAQRARSGSAETVTDQKMHVRSLLCVLVLAVAVLGKKDRHKRPLTSKKYTKTVPNSVKGLQCYNCLSYDHPGCWDPDHPEHANVTVPNIDCYIPGMAFLCLMITAESAKLIDTGVEIGPVRARTCVPAKDFGKGSVSHTMCNKLGRELAASEIFSRVSVVRPRCSLCNKNLCSNTC